MLNKSHNFEPRKTMPTFIIKEGARGVSVKNSRDTYLVPSGRTLTATDSIGAGDAFNAGFIFGMLTTHDIKTACQKGNEFAAERLMKQQR